MLCTNVGQRMLVAAEAGVLPPIARGVASETRRVVILVKCEKTRVIKGRRFPMILTVTLRALACGTAVNSGLGRNMTRGTVLPNCRVKQRVGKCRTSHRGQNRVGVTRVAVHTILRR